MRFRLWSLTMMLLMAWTAFGESIPKSTILELVSSATDVALIDVYRRSPVDFEFGGVKETCGFLYDAHVLISFKGEASSLRFFDAVNWEPDEQRGKFLVFALARDERSADIPSAKSSEEAKVRCRTSAGERWVSARPRGLLRLVQIEGGEWLEVHSKYSLNVDEFDHKPAADPNHGDLVRWDEVEAEIRRAVAAEAAGEPRASAHQK